MSQREPGIQEALLTQLAETWAAAPDLRLAQLLCVVIGGKEPCPTIFYEEDSALLEKLEAFLRS